MYKSVYGLILLLLGGLLLAAGIMAGNPQNPAELKTSEISLTCVDSCDSQYPGDYNNSGSINISDPTGMIAFFYQGGDPPDPLANGDPDGDCDMDMDDVDYLMDYIFRNGPAPVDCTCREPDLDSCSVQLPGDFNGSGSINISDVSAFIAYFYNGGPPPSPFANGDPDGDCDMDMDDVDYLMDYIFRNGPAPVDCTCRKPDFDSCSVQFPGDFNGSGSINISDVTAFINFFYHGGAFPSPLSNGDVDGDCDVDCDDLDALLNWLFYGGPAPVDCTCRLPTVDSCCVQYPGDVNHSGSINISDVTALIAYLCDDGTAPVPLSNADPNGDCVVDSLDVDYLIDYIFNSGPAPVACTCRMPVKGSCYSSGVDPDDLVARALMKGTPESAMPRQFSLHQNRPNPFNPVTEISFTLPEASDVRVMVYNILGQHVSTLVDGYQEAGEHAVIWNGTDSNGRKVSSGIYLYTIEAGQYKASRKMVLMK